MDLLAGYGEMSSDEANPPAENAIELRSKLKINAAPPVNQDTKV